MIGLEPREYYLMEPYEFFCTIEGYHDKQILEEKRLRFASYRIHQSLVDKPVPIEKFWPIEDDAPEQERMEMTPEILERIIKAHNVKPPEK